MENKPCGVVNTPVGSLQSDRITTKPGCLACKACMKGIAVGLLVFPFFEKYTQCSCLLPFTHQSKERNYHIYLCNMLVLGSFSNLFILLCLLCSSATCQMQFLTSGYVNSSDCNSPPSSMTQFVIHDPRFIMNPSNASFAQRVYDLTYASVLYGASFPVYPFSERISPFSDSKLGDGKEVCYSFLAGRNVNYPFQSAMHHVLKGDRFMHGVREEKVLKRVADELVVPIEPPLTANGHTYCMLKPKYKDGDEIGGQLGGFLSMSYLADGSCIPEGSYYSFVCEKSGRLRLWSNSSTCLGNLVESFVMGSFTKASSHFSINIGNFTGIMTVAVGSLKNVNGQVDLILFFFFLTSNM